ncbi:MAG: hypothetical protein Ct9H90mP14_0910 [Methanobacteriota archaeon]|nr:MAG: hypothetical protein Ct9H90mP14_0910 [Euryarchaeota archaeon]
MFQCFFSILTFYSVFYGNPAELNTYVLDTFRRIDSFDLDAVNRDFAVWVIAIDQALTWILVAVFPHSFFPLVFYVGRKGHSQVKV